MHQTPDIHITNCIAFDNIQDSKKKDNNEYNIGT